MKKAFLLLVLLFLIIGCSKEGEKKEVNSESLTKVISVNYPLHYFAEKIGGEQINALYPIPSEGDPAYWQPDENAIALYQSVDIILLNGADYAKWIKKVSLPSSKLVNTSKSFENEYIEIKEGTTHSHGPEGEHEHLGYAFTTWLNFKFAANQAEAIKDAFVKRIPDSKDYFEKNLSSLNNDLMKFDKSMNELSIRLKSKILFASHPVYQYLAGEYNLNILSEHWEPDEIPTDIQWENFKKKLTQNPSTIMLWEDEPLPEVAVKLNDLGIEVCVFNPCGNKPVTGDFISIMNSNIVNLNSSIK